MIHDNKREKEKRVKHITYNNLYIFSFSYYNKTNILWEKITVQDAKKWKSQN